MPQKRLLPRCLPQRKSHLFPWIQQQYWMWVWCLPKSFLLVRALFWVRTQVYNCLSYSSTWHTDFSNLTCPKWNLFSPQILFLNSVSDTTILPMTQTRKQGEALFLNLSCPIHQQAMSISSPTYISTLTTALNLCCHHPNLITGVSCLDRCNK